MAILQGNTYNLPVKIRQITKDTIGEVSVAQFIFGDTIKYYGQEDNTVSYDSVKECFIVPFSQEETFDMNKSISWQVRIKFTNGKVDGTRPKTQNVYQSITTEVL